MASIVQGYKFRSRREAFRFMTEAKEIGYKWPCNEIDPEKDSQTYADKGIDMWDDGEITYTDVNRYHKDFEGRSIRDLEDSSTWVVYARFYGMETKYKLKEWEDGGKVHSDTMVLQQYYRSITEEVTTVGDL